MAQLFLCIARTKSLLTPDKRDLVTASHEALMRPHMFQKQCCPRAVDAKFYTSDKFLL